MKHLNISVSGKVQGVWFRDSAKKKAWELGIHGIVRNEPDGTVYIEAEGEEEILSQLVDWCHMGPEKAEVQSVEVNDGPMENYTSFNVTYC